MKLTEALSAFRLSMSGVMASSTLTFYDRRMPRLVEYLGDVEITNINLSQLRGWREWLTAKGVRWGDKSSHPKTEGGYSPYTLHQFVRSTKRFFVWCYEEGYIDKDPARRLEKPMLPKKVAKGISAEAREILIRMAEGDPRAKLIILFLSDTACRVGGLANLQLDDLNLEEMSATIKEKGRGGWGKERTVFYTERTKKAIQEYLEIRPDVKNITTLLVGYKRGQNCGWCSFGHDGIRLTLKRLASKAGIKTRCNPHSFRHAAIRAWLNNGMPISEVAVLAGHSTVQVTADFYGIVSEAQLKKDYGKFSWLRAATEEILQ